MTDTRLERLNGSAIAGWGRLSTREITIIGAGTYGAVSAELAAECGYEIRSFLDDNEEAWGRTYLGAEISGPVDAALRSLPQGTAVAVALGDNCLRLRYLRQARELGHDTPTPISPGATVSPSATIEDGVFLHHGSHVWTQARLGLGTILSPHATVAHHTTLGGRLLRVNRSQCRGIDHRRRDSHVRHQFDDLDWRRPHWRRDSRRRGSSDHSRYRTLWRICRLTWKAHQVCFS